MQRGRLAPLRSNVDVNGRPAGRYRTRHRSSALAAAIDASLDRANFLSLMSQKKAASDRMEKIVSLCKRRGFVFQSSEIYGGLNGCWDYGPLGVELRRNLKEFWWRRMVRERDDVVGLDGSILMNRQVWVASGHETTFSDPMVDCRNCKSRLRADQLPEKNGQKQCPGRPAILESLPAK